MLFHSINLPQQEEPEWKVWSLWSESFFSRVQLGGANARVRLNGTGSTGSLQLVFELWGGRLLFSAIVHVSLFRMQLAVSYCRVGQQSDMHGRFIERRVKREGLVERSSAGTEADRTLKHFLLLTYRYYAKLTVTSHTLYKYELAASASYMMFFHILINQSQILIDTDI